MPLETNALIRAFQDEDTSSVIELWHELFFDPAPHNDPAQSIRQKIGVQRDLLYVGVVGSTVIGTVRGGGVRWSSWMGLFPGRQTGSSTSRRSYGSYR